MLLLTVSGSIPAGAFAYFFADESNDCFFTLTEVQREGQAVFEGSITPKKRLQRTVHRLTLAHGLFGNFGLDLARQRAENQ